MSTLNKPKFNNFRTEQEILDKIKSVSEDDICGWQREILVEALSFENAKPYLVACKDADSEKLMEVENYWNSRPSTIIRMQDYMVFAWDKALNHRGVSASRSIEKMKSYVWLLGGEHGINWDSYANYGCPILRQICETYIFPIPEDIELVRMSHGCRCTPGCDVGCDE